MTGVDLPGFNHSVASLSDTGTLQAQTQLLVLQVGKEVQANLDLIESALDEFFRDASKREGLASLGNLVRQVRGAFSMLEEYDAAALAGILAERVDPFASGAVRGEGDEAAAVAEGVSALGLYVERLQQGSPDARAVMLPALMRFGIAKKPPPARKLRGKGPVEKAVAETTQEGAGSPRDEAPAAAAAPVAPAALAALAIAREVLPSPGQDAACGPTATALPALPMDSTDVPSIAFPVPLPVAPRAGHASIAAGELEQLRRAEAGLKIGIEERDQRIRALQIQMVALHREARKAAALKAELKDLRAALAHAEKKAH
jgi:hypothetical protein